MYDVVSGILLLAATFGVGWAWGVRMADKTRAKSKQEEYPYEWSCMKPGCHYKLSANDVDWIMGLADSHAKRHSDI